MTGITYKAEGARELRRTLRRAGDDLGDLRETHRGVAQLVAGTARGLAPVVTGRLRSNIRPGATKTAAIVRAGGARVPYAGPIHWGWPNRGIEPHPFIADAAQQTEQVWVAQYLHGVQRILDRVQGATQ